MSKKIISLVLCAIMVLSIMPLSGIEVDAATTNKTRAEAIKWLESKEGKVVDYDGVYGGQCVDLIYSYCSYLGFAHSGPNASTYTTYKIPSDWARVQGGKKPQKGDILIYAGAGGYGHVAVYENDTSTWHQNADDKQYVVNLSYNYKNIKAADGSGYWGYIRPDFTDARSTIVKVTFNANGGTSSASSGNFVVGEIYGNTMPSATRDGYTFDGWYTSATGGTRVIRSTTVTSGNKTLYAHWTKNQSDVLQVGHVYRIYNEHSGLPIASNGSGKGALVCQRNKGEKGNGELWRVTAVTESGYYSFETLNGCLALDVDADDRYAFGASLQIYTKNSHDAQKFSIIRRGDKSGYSGLYSIHCKNSGRAIDVSGASTKSGAVLHQWDYHGGKAELFYFEEVTERNITFYDNLNNNYIVSPAEEYENIQSTTPKSHFSSRNTEYTKVTLKPETDSIYIQALKAGSSGKDMEWLTLINGSYTYNFCVANNSTMVLNFKAKSSVSGAKMYFRWGYESTYQAVALTDSWADYSVELKRTDVSGSTIHPYIDKACNVEIKEIALYEKGTTGYIGDTDAYTPQTVIADVNDDYIHTAPMPKNNKSGYSFNGWYTKRVGGTRVAGAGEYFSAPLEGHQKLYAHWDKNTENYYTLSYDANGGTGAPEPQTFNGDDTVYLSEEIPTRFGYVFEGWVTEDGWWYYPGQEALFFEDTVLYASWYKYEVSLYSSIIFEFDEENEEYYVEFVPEESGYYVLGTACTDDVLDTEGTLYDSNGNELAYNNDSFYNINFAVSYYFEAGEQYFVRVNSVNNVHGTTEVAVWQMYMITYDGNGGEVAYDADFGYGTYVIPENQINRDGYEFLGWSTDPSATEPEFHIGDSFEINNPLTLYAVWQADLPIDVPTTEPVSVTMPVPVPTTAEPSPIITKPVPSTTETAPITTKPVPTTTEPAPTTTKPVPSTTKPAPATTKPIEIVPSVEIRTPSRTTIEYGDSIVLHAEVKNLPEGAEIEWSASNGNFKIASTSVDGLTCIVTPESNGETVFTATIVDEDGNVISGDTQTMSAKAGLFQKIIAFFKKLFGLTTVFPEVYKRIF